jgi:site-specific recombinase XerD
MTNLQKIRLSKSVDFVPLSVKTYLHTLGQFILWLDVPIEALTFQKLTAYIDYLLDRRLQPKTINCHLNSIRRFYSYLHDQEQVALSNPVKRGCKLRLSRPLPKHLRDQDVLHFFSVIKNCRDRAMFMLMMRCGLQVEGSGQSEPGCRRLASQPPLCLRRQRTKGPRGFYQP